MIDALTLAAGSMQDDMARLAGISHNLANVANPGFKREIVMNRPFEAYLAAALGPRQNLAGTPWEAAPIAIDHRAGALKLTGNALDLAIEGEGFFELMSETGPLYTRQGSFRIDAGGRLVAGSGQAVMGSNGEIVLSSAQPRVDAAGRVFEEDKLVGQLRVVHFADASALVKAGSGVFQDHGRSEITATSGRVRQGHLESANVVPVNEMIKMIETMRHFESNQKVIQSYDDMLERAIRTLGES